MAIVAPQAPPKICMIDGKFGSFSSVYIIDGKIGKTIGTQLQRLQTPSVSRSDSFQDEPGYVVLKSFPFSQLAHV